jgi:hypothetical protein
MSNSAEALTRQPENTQKPQATAVMGCPNRDLKWVAVFPQPEKWTQFRGLDCPRCKSFSDDFTIHEDLHWE